MDEYIPVHDDVYWSKKSLRSKLYLVLQLILGLPKSIYFNLHYFGIRGMKLPVLCSYKTKFSKMKGIVKVRSKYKFGMIKIGFSAVELFDNSKLSTVWINDGIVYFQGSASIRNGTCIRNYGKLAIGNNFQVSATATIICYKQIIFGNDVLIGWNCEFSDGDAHKIYNENDYGERQNVDKAIMVGNNVWIGANVVIYKGVEIDDDVVVAGNAIVIKSVPGKNQVIGGFPARKLKGDIIWKI